MIISVASGKGGTGKTTVAVNMALSLEGPVQLLDCDVEEPNAHIFLKPQIREVRPVYVPVPKVEEGLCDRCGRCVEFCQFHAIAVLAEKVMVFPELCHGCGGCRLVCPRKAIAEENRGVGVVKIGTGRGIDFAYGELNLGEPMPGPVIRELKRKINRQGVTIIDVPPGTSCPVIESVYGSDYCLLVTEPTPLGLHDLKLMVEALREVKIPFGVVVNRAGLGDREVYEYCGVEGIPVLLEIPFDRRIAELYSQGTPFILEMHEWKDRFSSLFSRVKECPGR
ncbi:MAG: ATP-binding protein [Candidatus Bathyarchaeia archaeon]